MHYYFITNNGRPYKIVESTEPVDPNIMWAYRELTQEQREFYLAHPNASVYEVERCELYPQPPQPSELELARNNKLYEIDMYDTSDNVNGFYYNGMFMWLDKATRVGLVNTLNSAEMLQRETVNIWYNDQVCVELDIQSARLMLAALELYATDCYNATASHKKLVGEMETVAEIEAYDITQGYPQMLHFGTGTDE